MKKILFFIILAFTAFKLSAMNATQMFWHVQREVAMEKVKERSIYLPNQLVQAVAKHDDYEVARLLQAGVNPNISNQLGMPILNYAIFSGYTRIASLLISKGAYINGDGTYIPLHVAVRANKPAMVQLLLKEHADINKQDKAGYTALILAVEYNHPEIVKLLLQAGADRELENRYQERAIDIARKKQNQKLINVLLDSSLVLKK